MGWNNYISTGIVGVDFNMNNTWMNKQPLTAKKIEQGDSIIISDSVYMGLAIEGSGYFLSKCSAYNVVNFLQNHNKRHPIARPKGRDMGCLLLVNALMDIFFSVIEVMYAISCYIGPSYNSTQLY